MECGMCTLCCKVLRIRSTSSEAGRLCRFCDSEKLCTVYSDRPEECKTFNCSWKLDNNAHPSLRPDRCHVVFENLREDIVFGSVDPNYHVDNLIERQIKAFLRCGSSVVLHTLGDRPSVYVAANNTAEQVCNFIQEKIKEYNI